jgi:hypothetical protein
MVVDINAISRGIVTLSSESFTIKEMGVALADMAAGATGEGKSKKVTAKP